MYKYLNAYIYIIYVYIYVCVCVCIAICWRNCLICPLGFAADHEMFNFIDPHWQLLFGSLEQNPRVHSLSTLPTLGYSMEIVNIY